MKKWQAVLLVVMIVVGLYACVRVAIDPQWYFGKSFVPEYVTQEMFWDYVRSAR